MATDIESKVIEMVAQQMGVSHSSITRETRFGEDLGADSLDEVELLLNAEHEFELSISTEDAEQFQTVGKAIDYIKQHAALR